MKLFPPTDFLRRRRRLSRLAWVAGVILVAVLVWADRSGAGFYSGSDRTRYEGRAFRVVAVIDGDTLDLDVPDGQRSVTRVRLWGINTPEKAGRGRGAQRRASSAERAEALAFGQWVTLSLEPQRLRGKYGRLLAFVTLPDGTVLNERLLIEGVARADDRWHHRHAERYARLEEQARHERRGLWFEPPPGIAGQR